MLFAADYKHFYCRFSDPSYVKKLKLEMLTAVANETNTYDIGKVAFCLLLEGATILLRRSYSVKSVLAQRLLSKGRRSYI
jgi:hypothetical protein